MVVVRGHLCCRELRKRKDEEEEKKRSITKCARIVFTIFALCARCVIVGVERGGREKRKEKKEISYCYGMEKGNGGKGRRVAAQWVL